MYDYREVRAIKEGILINKEYYEFLHSYKENQELKDKLEKNKITKKEYKYLEDLRERKELKNHSDEMKLIKWEDIKSWYTHGKIGKTKVVISVKGLKKDIEPNFISNKNLIYSLEKYSFGKGKIDRNTALKFANFYLYFIYFIILLICLYMFISIVY